MLRPTDDDDDDAVDDDDDDGSREVLLVSAAEVCLAVAWNVVCKRNSSSNSSTVRWHLISDM